MSPSKEIIQKEKFDEREDIGASWGLSFASL